MRGGRLATGSTYIALGVLAGLNRRHAKQRLVPMSIPTATPGVSLEVAAYAAVMSARQRRARVEDVHELALGMPHVKVEHGPRGNPVYQVGGKSFVFFRTPRPDAVDPETGERYTDVIMFWVPSEHDKQALVQDQVSPFFTTPHFDGHPSVLLLASRIGELTLQELTEVLQEAWLSQASPKRAATWLNAQRGAVGNVEG